MKTISANIEDHPVYLAGKAAALAQLYYDNVLNSKMDLSEVSKAYTDAFNLCPNYRMIIQQTGKRYNDTLKNPEMFLITSLPVKPKMNIRELEMSDFSLVSVRSSNLNNPTPHCAIHGAMNKITLNEDGGGIWRCLSAHSYRIVKNGNSISRKENDTPCRAGCMQIK